MKFGQDPHIDKSQHSWKCDVNPIILSTFFGQDAKFDIFTGGKISKNSPLKSDFDEICRKMFRFSILIVMILSKFQEVKEILAFGKFGKFWDFLALKLKRPRYWFSAKTIMIFGLSDPKTCKKDLNLPMEFGKKAILVPLSLYLQKFIPYERRNARPKNYIFNFVIQKNNADFCCL